MFVLIAVVLLLLVCLIYQNSRLRADKEIISELTMWHTVALTDDLTGISNRAAYSNHIKELGSNINDLDSGSGIVLFDIDDFKQINDTHGHLAGDRVLQKCAGLLCEIFAHEGCSVYRIGGDEFAVIACNVGEEYIIDALLKIKMREELGLGFRLSKGYAVFGDKKDISTVFEYADEMLYADKVSRS